MLSKSVFCFLFFYNSDVLAVPVWQCLKPEYKIQYPTKNFYDSLWKIDSLISEGSSLGAILLRYQGIAKNDFYALLLQSKNKDLINSLKKDTLVTAYLAKDNCHFIEARIQLPENKELRIFKENQRLVDRIYQLPIKYRTVYKEFTVNHSLFADGNKIGVSDKILSNIEAALAGKVNFSKVLARGDQFRVLYDKLYTTEDKFLKSGHIWFAEYKRKNGKVYQFGRYTSKQGKQCYLDAQRKNLEASFIRNPVKYTRISSGFSPRRKHPVLHVFRSHKGVDFAAPKGTPVRAVYHGVVIKKYYSQSYGNVVFIKHGKRYTTVYAHLNRFAKNLKKGSKVDRAQVIGYVGTTGLSTGYHLHYEFRIDNKHHDPLKVELPNFIDDENCHIDKQSYTQQRNVLMDKIAEIDKQLTVKNDNFKTK